MAKSRVKVKRRMPRPAELSTLLKFKKPILSPKRRRLARALTIYDLQKILALLQLASHV